MLSTHSTIFHISREVEWWGEIKENNKRTDEERQPVRPKCAREDDHQESYCENEGKQDHG